MKEMIIMAVVKGIKLVIGFFVAMGVSTIVREGIKSVTPAKVGIFKKIGILISGAVISSLLIDKTNDYANNKIDLTAKEIANGFVNSNEF